MTYPATTNPVAGSASPGSTVANRVGTGPAGPTSALALPRPNRCVVIGVLNVTPDSFSDGGRYLRQADAITHGVAMWTRGADLIDVGGESTRPGAHRVAPEVEISRVIGVIKGLVAEGVPVSVDTTRARVAEAALDAGALLVNDVSGGLADPDMATVVAERGVPWVLMHWRGHSKDMTSLANYADVVTDVRDELSDRVDAALAAGVSPDALVLDPGLGFAKRAEHDWALLHRLDVLCKLGFPVLVGASRKRFLGRLLAEADGTPRPPGGREVATAAISALAAAAGVWGVRVHDVGSSLDAIAVATAWQRGGTGSMPSVAALASGVTGSPVAASPAAPMPTSGSSTVAESGQEPQRGHPDGSTEHDSRDSADPGLGAGSDGTT
jgi:dihydropteroate synthase